jgi:uracil-DNA glycosylase family 4
MLDKPAACSGCPLEGCGKGYVPGSGPKDARLLVVGEAPGKDEIEAGIPFVGKSGEKLDLGLGGTRSITRVENVRRCLPPEDESDEMRDASIAHCTKAYLNQEPSGARAVLLVGADALEWGVGTRAYSWTDEKGRRIQEPGIMQYHGSVFTGPEADKMHFLLRGRPSKLPPGVHTVVATLHPAFALRGQQRFMVEILTNISRAVAAANTGAPKPRAARQTIYFNPTLEMTLGAETVIDIETPENNPNFIELVCFTETPTQVSVFDWDFRVKAKAAEVFANKAIKKIGHNFGYDLSAFIANGIEIKQQGDLVDTIIAAARIWPPTPQKKLNEQAAKEKIPVRWLSLDRVIARLLPDWVYHKRPESRATRAFYQAAFPKVPSSQYRMLYNGLDGIGNHRAWVEIKQLLQRLGLTARFEKIDMPALLPIIHMEQRGMLVDENRRALLQQECEQTKAEAEERILALAQPFHEKRRAAVTEAVKNLESEVKTRLQYGMAHCAVHPDYYGQTRREKNACCKTVRESNAILLAELKELKGQIKKGGTILKQIGERFDPAKPDHWRWLLFDKDGLNSERPKDKQIKPTARTPKTKLPQIDADAMEKLQRQHPDLEIFRQKIDATYAEWRLNNTLAVEVDKDGYAHTKLSIFRASTARYSSGTDREDSDKIRYAAAGNQQNIPDADRSIYIAPDGWLIMQPDYSQIEARDTAHRARETALLDAWKRGEDIHTNNAVMLAAAIGVKLKPEDARDLIFPYDPQRKSYRDNGKILTHAWDYGMDDLKTSRDYGLPLDVARRLRAAYFATYPKLMQRIRDVEAEALENGWLTNAFGLRLGPYAREKKNGIWRLVDRNEALASQPQSDVGDMMKIVSKALDDWPNWAYTPTLRTTMHDNFWIYFKQGDDVFTAHGVRMVMEREWPQLGFIEGYGYFRCPVEISIGKNGGKYHKHDAKCLARGCDATENPEGLEKMRG